jgi:thymidine phosphorylase
MVAAQGGDLDAPRPVAPAQDVTAPRAGYVAAIDTEGLGRVIIELGGGRKQLGDKLDLSTGLEMLVRLGDAVEAGRPIVRVFAKPQTAAAVEADLLRTIAIGDNRVEPPPLIVERIS